jgi:hypothetical protein
MKYSITNLSTLERVDCLHDSERHLLDEVQEVLELQWDLVPATNRCSWAFPFLRGEVVWFRTADGRKVKVWKTFEGIWVKEI